MKRILAIALIILLVGTAAWADRIGFLLKDSDNTTDPGYTIGLKSSGNWSKDSKGYAIFPTDINAGTITITDNTTDTTEYLIFSGTTGTGSKSLRLSDKCTYSGATGILTCAGWATTRGAWGQRIELSESNAYQNDLFGIVANGNIATQRWFVPLAALTAGQVPAVDSVAGDNATLKGLSITIPKGCTFDGGGSELADNATCYTNVPFKGVIKSWAIGAKSSSVLGGVVTFRAYKDTSANYPPTMPTDAICTTNSPRIATNALHAESDNMTGWTTSVAAGDWIGFHVASDDNITWASVTLNIQMVP